MRAACRWSYALPHHEKHRFQIYSCMLPQVQHFVLHEPLVHIKELYSLVCNHTPKDQKYENHAILPE
jgi:hypothetical protein